MGIGGLPWASDAALNQYVSNANLPQDSSYLFSEYSSQ